MKKLLFTRESRCLQPIRKLIEKQKHRTLVWWSLECAKHILPIFEKNYPQDKRPRKAIQAAKDWAGGKIKMPLAKQAALASHKAASAVVVENPAACAAARAIGHAVATVHVETHAIGVVMYGLTAFVYANKQKNIAQTITRECSWFYNRLLFWESNIAKVKINWAGFLLKDNITNKEALLRQKLAQQKNRQK